MYRDTGDIGRASGRGNRRTHGQERRDERSYPERGRGVARRSQRRGTGDDRRAPQRERRAGNRQASSGRSGRAPQRRRGLPWLTILALVLVVALGVGIAIFATRRSMMPLVEEAQQETQQAKSQVSTLTAELDRLATELDSTREQLEKASKEVSAQGTQTGVDDPWVQTGKYTSGSTVLDSEVKAFCDSLVDTSMDVGDAAYQVYLSIAWSDYEERDAAQHPTGKDWRTTFARMYYENGCSGNCYEFATFLSYCLQYLGYDDATAEGVDIELQSGDMGDHCIVFVTNTDGSSCLCDTSRGADGWMLGKDVYNYQVVDLETA